MPKPVVSESKQTSDLPNSDSAKDVRDSADSTSTSESTQHLPGTQTPPQTSETVDKSRSAKPLTRSTTKKKSARTKAKTPKDFIGISLAAGRYRVKSQLGQGSMAYVFLAADSRLETDVVVKVPKPEKFTTHDFRDRFKKECQLLVRFSHPHVVGVLDVGEYEKLPYVVMQLLSGGSLADLLQKESNDKGQMQPEFLKTWLPGVARALDFCARKGMIHRDVKPANILFDGERNPYVSDFGLSKVMYGDHTDLNSSETAAGAVLGTPNYVAPEIVMGKDYDGRADQYSLGISVYHTLLGRPPMQGANATATMINQTTRQLQLLSDIRSDVPRELALAIRKSIDKKPANRFESCEEFSEAALESLRAPTTKDVSSTAAAPSLPATKKKRKKSAGTTSSQSSARKKKKSNRSGRTNVPASHPDLEWLDLAGEDSSQSYLPPKKGKGRAGRSKKKTKKKSGRKGVRIALGAALFSLLLYGANSFFASDVESDPTIRIDAGEDSATRSESDDADTSAPPPKEPNATTTEPEEVTAAAKSESVNLWDWDQFDKTAFRGYAAEGIVMDFEPVGSPGAGGSMSLKVSFTVKEATKNWAQLHLRGADFSRDPRYAKAVAELDVGILDKLRIEFDYLTPDDLVFSVTLASGPTFSDWKKENLKISDSVSATAASEKFEHVSIRLIDADVAEKRFFVEAMNSDPVRSDFFVKLGVHGRDHAQGFPTSSLTIRNLNVYMVL